MTAMNEDNVLVSPTADGKDAEAKPKRTRKPKPQRAGEKVDRAQLRAQEQNKGNTGQDEADASKWNAPTNAPNVTLSGESAPEVADRQNKRGVK
jgi:hypothetical protein